MAAKTPQIDGLSGNRLSRMAAPLPCRDISRIDQDIVLIASMNRFSRMKVCFTLSRGNSQKAEPANRISRIVAISAIKVLGVTFFGSHL
jgi:hypothetical protein